MIRIFISLAIFALLMMALALCLGLFLGDIHHVRDVGKLHLATVHRLLGLAAAIVVVLVNSIAVTYFVGTGRWCKEVSEAYELDPQFVRRSVKIKRGAFPWALFSMLVVVGVGALGAAADPMTGRVGTENWVTIHLLGALAGLVFIAIAFYFEGVQIAAHHQVIEDILSEVRRIRTERGLEV